MAGHLELLGEVDLGLATGRNLDTITSARLSWYPYNLTVSYPRLQLAFTLTSLADHLTVEGSGRPELYALLSEALRTIDTGADGALVELWFKLRWLELSGYRPELVHCVVCGGNDAGSSYSFSAEHGGIMDETCRTAITRPMPTATIKLWRILSDYPYVTVAQIGGAEALAAESLGTCDEFYAHHVGRAFRKITPGVAS